MIVIVEGVAGGEILFQPSCRREINHRGREIDHRGQEIVFFSLFFSKRFNRFTEEVQAGSNWKEPVCELAELGIHRANLFETNSNWNLNSLTPRFTMQGGLKEASGMLQAWFREGSGIIVKQIREPL